MITTANISQSVCPTCKETVTGTFLFRYTHENNCKQQKKDHKTSPIKESYSSDTQCQKLQGSQVYVKTSRF